MSDGAHLYPVGRSIISRVPTETIPGSGIKRPEMRLVSGMNRRKTKAGACGEGAVARSPPLSGQRSLTSRGTPGSLRK